MTCLDVNFSQKPTKINLRVIAITGSKLIGYCCFTMERYCTVEQNTIFSRYFELYFINSSSVARMRREGEERVFKGKKPKKSHSRENRDIYDKDDRETQRRVHPPPSLIQPNTILQFLASIVWRTRSHMSVLAYASMSSLRPLPGPHLFRRKTNASRIFRSFMSFRLCFPCAVVMTDAFLGAEFMGAVLVVLADT